jgi:hypothetical protein
LFFGRPSPATERDSDGISSFDRLFIHSFSSLIPAASVPGRHHRQVSVSKQEKKMHQFMNSRRLTAGLMAATTLCAAPVIADLEVALDFGTGSGADPVFTGTFDGSSGFIGFGISDNGVVESPAMELGGGVTFGFTNVSGWNNTDGATGDDPNALGKDHLFSSALGADDPAAFYINGLQTTDIVKIEFLDRFGGEAALVTFNGVQTLVDADVAFTDVSGGGVTGMTSYEGNFTGAGGSGEGNLAGARITVTSIPAPGAIALLGLGGLATAGRRRRA